MSFFGKHKMMVFVLNNVKRTWRQIRASPYKTQNNAVAGIWCKVPLTGPTDVEKEDPPDKPTS